MIASYCYHDPIKRLKYYDTGIMYDKVRLGIIITLSCYLENMTNFAGERNHVICVLKF
jgi:hypothetical protein